MASQEGFHDVVQTLLGEGTDVNITRSDVSDVIFYYCMYMIKIWLHAPVPN